MGYNDWFENHATKHKAIVEKLVAKEFKKEQIVEYFCYENMVENELEFCPLYKKGKKCHDMEKLNCYLCACPNFRFNEEGLSEYSGYKILSRCDIHNGKEFAGKGVIHQDCSSCSVPHHKSYVLKNFSLDWREIMSKCRV
jgi:hypothetical protein